MDSNKQLIVALDQTPGQNANLLHRLLDNSAIRFFKLRRSNFLREGGWQLAATISHVADLMIDLKDYDPSDSIEDSVKAAFDLGARFVTVHATPSIMDAAMRAKPRGGRYKILAVGPMTDRAYVTYSWTELSLGIFTCDGVICPPTNLRGFRGSNGHRHTEAIGKLLVSPGIRPEWHADVNNHQQYCTPARAVRNGADYIVVGRPIYEAEDPVIAAYRVLEEMAGVGA